MLRYFTQVPRGVKSPTEYEPMLRTIPLFESPHQTSFISRPRNDLRNQHHRPLLFSKTGCADGSVSARSHSTHTWRPAIASSSRDRYGPRRGYSRAISGTGSPYSAVSASLLPLPQTPAGQAMTPAVAGHSSEMTPQATDLPRSTALHLALLNRSISSRCLSS